MPVQDLILNISTILGGIAAAIQLTRWAGNFLSQKETMLVEIGLFLGGAFAVAWAAANSAIIGYAVWLGTKSILSRIVALDFASFVVGGFDEPIVVVEKLANGLKANPAVSLAFFSLGVVLVIYRLNQFDPDSLLELYVVLVGAPALVDACAVVVYLLVGIVLLAFNVHILSVRHCVNVAVAAHYFAMFWILWPDGSQKEAR